MQQPHTCSGAGPHEVMQGCQPLFSINARPGGGAGGASGSGAGGGAGGGVEGEVSVTCGAPLVVSVPTSASSWSCSTCAGGSG